MNKDARVPFRLVVLWTAVLVYLLAGCGSAATPAPVVEIVTVVNTVEVTHEVTSEVTRLVDLPVTETPTPTLDQTATPSLTPSRTRVPSATPTWNPPKVSILEHSACLYGPGWAYLYKYGLNATVWMRVIGRNSDGTWLFVRAGNDPDWKGCWIETTRVEFLSGDVSEVPVYWMGLPGSTLYLPPAAVNANRVGNEVTIFWEAVWMTEDDYRGYLIEAWVCQGGQHIFLPVGINLTYEENVSTISVTIMDEAGCAEPSSARIATASIRGYTLFEKIFWPPH